jgi:aminomethyltransferase
MTPTAQPGNIAVPAAPTLESRVPGSDFGDTRGEFQALISACGVFNLSSRSKISLTGGDRVRWLNGMVTNNVRDLAPGRGIYAFLLNPQGHILGDLYAYNRGESLLVDTDQVQAEKVLAVFEKYIIMDDVEVANITDRLTAIGITGPDAGASLEAAGLKIPALEPLQFVELPWQQLNLTLVRSDHPGVEKYEIWLEPAHVPQLQEALLKAGAKMVGAAALELLRIAAGIPRYGVDIRERDLPQETEQQRALNFSKGCYIGQEIVERIRSRGSVHRKFTGFEVQGPLPARGARIQVDGKEIGEITSAATLPLADGDRQVALGYVRREGAASGKQLEFSGSRLTVANLPFAGIFT